MRVCAAQDAGAGAGIRGRIHGEFQRANLRFVAEMTGEQLIDRDIRNDLDFGLAATRRARKKRSGSACVNVIPTRPQTGQHKHLVPVRRHRLENRGKLEVGAFALRRPILHRHSVRDVEGHEPVDRFTCRSCAWDHRIEKGQRDRCSDSPQHRSP